MPAYAHYPSLKQRVVFITGGGSGIGASMVEHFCTQHAQVAFVDIDSDASITLCASLSAQNLPEPMFIQCDLKKIDALQAAIAQVTERLGPIRVLVNNAANDDRHHIDQVTPEYWDDRIAVNLRHQFFAAQAVYKNMAAAGGGSIINMGSVSWVLGMGGMPCYTTAKSAVMGLTRSLARDLGPMNIRVNSILPGWIMTERQKDKWLTAEGERELLARQCLKRKLLPQDIARIALFFAADDSAILTNQNYIADGGWA